MKSKLLITTIVIAVLIMVKCSTDSDTNPTGSGTSISVPLELKGTISSDSTLKNRELDSNKIDYRITNTLNVNAKLTIEPGVIIQVDQSFPVIVNSMGSLVANGKDTMPIVIKGTQNVSGFWKGIRILSNNTSNELSYIRIENAGSTSFTGLGIKSALSIGASGRCKLHHANIETSGGHGIYLEGGSSVIENFEHNVITTNTQSPVYCKMQHFKFFDTTSSYTGNGSNFITGYYNGVDAEVIGEHVWQPINVPFLIQGVDQKIEGSVLVLPGTQIKAVSRTGIIVLPTGSFKAVGSQTRPITIMGEQDVPGYWKGFRFESNSTENEMAYLTIANGGSDGFDGKGLKSNIILDNNARLKLHHATVRTSSGSGLIVESEGGTLPDFEMNNFTNNGQAPIRILPSQFKFLDTNTTFSGNGKERVEEYQIPSRRIDGEHVWKAIKVPFYIVSIDFDVNGPLTINPGAVVMAGQNAGINVTQTGSLNAVGTSSKPIVFKGEQDVQGYWLGLRFESNSASNILTNVTVANGGSKGFDGANRKANIELANGSRLSISSSVISKSGGVGIRNLGGVFTQSTLTFSGNIGIDIQNN